MQTDSDSVVTIDATQRKPISPFLYGVNFPDWDRLGLPFPLARQGGNRMSAYNWETNASNAGADWRHQNDGYLGETDTPAQNTRTFLDDARRHGAAAAIVTVPMTGYVAADKRGDGDVNQSENYLETRFCRSLPKKPGPLAFPPDTRDRVVYQDEYVAYVERIKDRLPVWYALDNEPDIWAHTHARLVARTPTYDAFIARSIEYAAAIKAVAPRALVAGPVSYGWQGFRRFQDAEDARGRDFLDVYLSALRAAERQQGKRLLDILDIHFYPEARGGGARITEDRPGTAPARLQAPRSLWDPTYVEESWIAQSLGNRPLALLPGLLKQIAAHYPGTKLAITEYHYGGRRERSGMLAQADVLGIYGRYGVFAACIWGMGPDDSATRAAFQAFLNFDGKGARFGDLGLAVRGETPAADSVYAALDSKKPGRLTVVALNKTEAPRPLRLRFAGYAPARASAYVFTQEPGPAPPRPAARLSPGEARLETAPMSVTVLELQR